MKGSGILVWGLIAAVGIGLVWWGQKQENNQTGNGEEYKIGGAFALSGFAAEWGVPSKNGTALAIEEINQGGGIDGRQITLAIEDTQSANNQTIFAVSKLINADQVRVIIGPTWLDSYIGAGAIAEDSHVLMLAPDAAISAVKSEKNYQHVFSTWYRTEAASKKLAELLAAQGKKRVVFLYEQDPFYADFAKFLKAELERLGVEVIQENVFSDGTIDFRTTLIKIKEASPDAVTFGLNGDRESLALFKQKRELYPDMPLYTSEYIEAFTTRDEYKPLLGGILFVAPKVAESDFARKYKEKFGIDPAFGASNSYDAMQIMAEALEKNNFDVAAARNYVAKNSFDTVTFGKVKFDEIGGITGGEFIIKKINQAGEAEFYNL